jgi:hypothetical protein
VFPNLLQPANTQFDQFSTGVDAGSNKSDAIFSVETISGSQSRTGSTGMGDLRSDTDMIYREENFDIPDIEGKPVFPRLKEGEDRLHLEA